MFACSLPNASKVIIYCQTYRKTKPNFSLIIISNEKDKIFIKRKKKNFNKTPWLTE